MLNEFYLVGIGASAGGLEAFESLLAHLPVHDRLALVLVRHLAPQHKSLSAKLLEKHTSYPIKAIEEGMQVEAGVLYVLTESHKLEIRNNHFHVSEKKGEKRKLYPIDYFFGSLAEAYGPRAIAVLLSGAGTDGSFAIQAIRDRGGRVLVQHPDEAHVNGMPVAAAETGVADLVGTVAELGAYLQDLVQDHPQPPAIPALLSDDLRSIPMLTEIIHFLSSHTELDLKEYKSNTLYRRIIKRMSELQLQDPERYLALLQERPAEVQRLKHDMLIGFTDFLRDKEAFEAIVTEVFPLLFKDRLLNDPLRLWCAGCSTGEEAYTMAILLMEYMQHQNHSLPFTVFASDINEESLRIATEGRYATLPQFLSAEQADKYFYEQNGLFVVRKEVRKHLVFTRHNLLKNPPFIHIDLLSCRNVLIYLLPAAQKKLFMKFHFALKPGGVLFLGSNESNGALKKVFEPFNKKWKIFINSTKPEKFSRISGYLDYTSPTASVVSMKKKNQADSTSYRPDYFESMLMEHHPPSIFLNEDQEVVFTHGNVDAYIKIRGKQPSLKILNLLDDTLKVIFRSSLRKLENGSEDVLLTDLSFGPAAGQHLSLRFQKITDPDSKQVFILVKFMPLLFISPLGKARLAESRPDGGEQSDSHLLEEMERELNFARLELQEVSDELELTNEKLQTANEELLSANEELQSMNEELQSANEELSSLNSELNESLYNLRETHNDLSNLLNATEIGVIFLDERLRIRKFTPLTKELFNIQEEDTGRYLKDFTNNFHYTAFDQDARQVLDRLAPLEKEVLDVHTGTIYLMRILPYKTQEQIIGGVVMLLIDISGLKKVQDQMLRLNDELKRKADELGRAENNWKSLMTNLPDVVARYDKSLNLVYISDAFLRETGQAAEQLLGKNAEDIAIESSRNDSWIQNMHKVLRTGEKIVYTTEIIGKRGPRHYHVVLAPEFDQYGEAVDNVLVIFRDISELIKYEQQLQEKIAELEFKESELTRINQYLDNFVYTAAHDLRSPVANLTLLLNLFDKSAQKDRIKQELHSSVAKLDHTLVGLVEVIEAQNTSSSVAKELVFQEVWERVSSDFKEDLQQADARIFTDFSQRPKITYIESFLESIFRNMLSNALKYRSDDRRLQLAMSTEPADGLVLLKIKDNGMGMDLKRQGKDLFKPFSRLTKAGKGKGIGLHIVKNMIEKNGGQIEVESIPDFGTSFSCYLREYSY